MFDYLDKLRAKPIHVRKRIAFFSTAFFAAIILSVWWNTWNAETATPPLAEAPVLSPWGVVRDTFGRMKGETVGAFKGVTNQLQYAADESGKSAAATEEAVLGGEYDGDASVERAATGLPANVSTSTTGEALHTRPRSLERVASGDVVQ